jgi:hypothetical protein
MDPFDVFEVKQHDVDGARYSSLLLNGPVKLGRRRNPIGRVMQNVDLNNK